jgi:hypothetical protein
MLSSCGLFSFGQTKSHKSRSLPRAPQTKVPDGTGDNWRYIGTTSDGMMIIEINNNTIIPTKQKVQIFNFSDRKTIADSAQYSYPSGQPHFKYIVNTWQMDCSNKQYLITSAKMYSLAGAILKQYDYSHDDSVKWMSFGSGSIAELEYKYVCLNQNRNLGY